MTQVKEAISELKLSRFAMITLAGFVNAFGITMFLQPVSLYDSGISGTSMLLDQLTPEGLTLSVFLIVLNIPLFLFGLKKQGIPFTVYSVYAVAIYSLGAFLMTEVLPIELHGASPMAGTDLLLCAVFGGIISGVGSGLTIRFGGAIDGIEVMAVIFAKKIGLSVGSFVMIYNVILYIVCGVLFNSWILPLYSIVTYMAASKTVDFVVEGFDRAKAAMIITVKPDEVCHALQEEFRCGTTLISAQGGYSRSQKTIVYFVVNRFQISKMKDIVHEVDETAYITINEVADVLRADT